MAPLASPTTPEALLERFRSTGDPAALGDLFDQTAPELFRLALSVAPDAAAAEDALQETFLALFEAAHRHDPGRPVLPWLVGILKLKVHEVRRRVRRTPDPRRLVLPAGQDGESETARRRERTEPVRRALEELPEPYRAVALLRWRYGLSPAEIAHVRGEPPGTVWSLLSRALERLRRSLGRLACVVLGLPLLRGLDEVKRSLLAKATLGLGGTVMAKKGIVAAGLLLLAAGGGYAVWSGVGRAPRAEPAAAPLSADARTAQADAPTGPVLVGQPDAAARRGEAQNQQQVQRYRGAVVGTDDLPIAGATVWATLAWDKDGQPIGAAPGERATTGADGRFALQPAIETSRLMLTARAPGRTRPPDPNAGWAWPERDARLVLPRGCGVRVRVVDERTGAALPGADVQVFAMRPGTFGDTLRGATPSDEGTSDAEGRVVLCAPGGPTYVWACTERHAPGVASIAVLSEAGAEVTLSLGTGGTVDGVVVDDRGTPVVGAELQVFAALRYGRVATTDAGGTFRFEHVPAPTGHDPGRATDLTLSVSAQGWPQLALTEPVPKAGERRELRIALRRGGVLEGTVRRSDGTSHVGVEVTVQRADPPSLQVLGYIYVETVRTDAAGRFAFADILPGRVQISVTGAGDAPKRLTVDLPTRAVDVVIDPPKTPLVVEVRDAEGAAVAGARLSIRPAGSASGHESGATTGEDGTARFESLPDTPLTVFVDPPGAAAVDVAYDPAVARGRLIVRLGGGVIEGRVQRLDGAAAQVRVGLQRPVTFGKGTTLHLGELSQETDAEGRFAFRGVSEGRYRLAVLSPGWLVMGLPQVLHGGDREVHLVVATAAEAAPRRLRVDLAARDTGEPISGWAEVKLRREGAGEDAWAWLTPDLSALGAHRSREPLLPGTYEIFARPPGWRAVRSGLRIGADAAVEPARLLLDRGAQIVGRVMDQEGKPIRNAMAWADGQFAQSGEDGTFTLGGLEPGPAEVKVTGTYIQESVRRLDASVAPTPIEVRVEVGGAIDVHLEPGAEARRGFVVRAVPVGGGAPRELRVEPGEAGQEWDRRSDWSLSGVPAGRWRIEVAWEGKAQEPYEFDVPLRDTISIRVGPR